VKNAARYRIDDLRRCAIALGSGAGLSPVRAAGLAAHLLWYDLAGASAHGIATLPGWLERMADKRIDPREQGKILSEHASTAVLDGARGLPPLVLARAGTLASEKAREVGVGLVRVVNLAATGPATAIAADMALGPQAAWVMGPGPRCTLALPAPEGMPAVFDSSLGDGKTSAESLKGLAVPWRVFAADDGWVVVALAIAAIEALATFHERVSAALGTAEAAAAVRTRQQWDLARAEARERGLPLADRAVAELRRWAVQLGAAPPTPIPD
jgi:LDH2 family malate/lactate/ureidoglycolate dehydrogenase